MHSNNGVFLKPQVKIEPLTCGWYVWPHLIAPAQLAMNLNFRLLPLMHSFVTNPAAHLAASSDPKMYGGPFMSLAMEDVPRVKRLMEETRQRCARLLTFAVDLKRFTGLLEAEATGFSLNGFYARLPQSLRGLVECVYDASDRSQVRLFESLLYDEGLVSGTQEIFLQLVGERDRHFFMSTPRLDCGNSLRFEMTFSDKRLDVLASMRTQARPFKEIADLFAVSEEAASAFAELFTSTPPAVNGAARYSGDGVRMRYFGHACVLLQTGQDLISEMSNSRVIFSETRTPPVSSAALKFTPQSLRLMTARPSKPARWLPYGSVARPVNSKSTLTGSVVSLMVRSPVSR